MTDLTPTLTMRPWPRVALVVEVPSYWRTSTADGVYAPDLRVLIPPAAGAGTYVGTNPGVLVDWQVTRHCQLQGAITRFLPGAFLKNTFVSPGFDGTGGAYAFNGNSRVVIPDSPSLNPGSQDVTLTAHVKTSTLPGSVGDYDLIRKKKNAQIYKMEILGTGTGYCQFKGTAANARSSRPSPACSAWATTRWCSAKRNAATGAWASSRRRRSPAWR